jgi:hypothetical protein
MSQQLAILVLVDVAAALRAGELKGHTYLIDNMKLQGSEGEGTGDLVTAVNGTFWSDGSQADAQVLNWVLLSLGSVPPTVPRNFHVERARDNERTILEGLAELADVADRVAYVAPGSDGVASLTPGREGTDIVAKLKELRRQMGIHAHVKSEKRPGTTHVGHKVMDVRGHFLEHGVEDYSSISYPPPLLANITGEAVDKKIIHPARYGSPDIVTDGWYWSASVDTSRPGTYAYTMEIHLHEPHRSEREGPVTWTPVSMSYESRIKVDTTPKRNGFTQAGIGLLPVS